MFQDMRDEKRMRNFFCLRRKGSVAMEAVLLLPLLLLLAGIFGQYMDLSKSRVFAEHAAYAAARSALAHKCPPPASGSLLTGRAPEVPCRETPERWIDAARWSLASASPSSDYAAARGLCPDLSSAEFAALAAGLPERLRKAYRNRLCYAFEPGNVEVEVEWRDAVGEPWPVEALVRFKTPLVAPIGLFLADGRRADGTRWAWSEARVVVR